MLRAWEFPSVTDLRLHKTSLNYSNTAFRNLPEYGQVNFLLSWSSSPASLLTCILEIRFAVSLIASPLLDQHDLQGARLPNSPQKAMLKGTHLWGIQLMRTTHTGNKCLIY